MTTKPMWIALKIGVVVDWVVVVVCVLLAIWQDSAKWFGTALVVGTISAIGTIAWASENERLAKAKKKANGVEFR